MPSWWHKPQIQYNSRLSRRYHSCSPLVYVSNTGVYINMFRLVLLLGEGPTCVVDFTLHYFLLQFLILCLTNRTTLTGVLHKMLIFTELINTAHRFVVYYCGHYTHINTVQPSYFRKVRLNALLRAHSSPPVGLPGGPIPSGFLYCSWYALPFCPTHAACSAQPILCSGR